MDDAVALLKSNEDKQEVKCLTSPCLKHKMTIIRIDKYGCLTQSSGSMRLLCILATVALAAVRNKFLILDTDQGERFLVDTGESKNQDTNQDLEKTKEGRTYDVVHRRSILCDTLGRVLDHLWKRSGWFL